MPKLTKEWIESVEAPATGQAYYWDEDTTGLGLVVGHTGVKSFVYAGRVRGKKGGDGKDIKRRVTIGIVGAPREDGHPWTVRLARDAADALRVQMAQGIDPNESRRKVLPPPSANASGPTLRDAMEAHLAHQRKKDRSERTIGTFEAEMTKYLGDAEGKYLGNLLDRPIADITGAVLVDLHELIKKQARDKANRNERNDKGAPLANRVITEVSAAWNTLNRKLEGKLGSWNPAKSVVKDTLKPKRERLLDLHDWKSRVETMRNPIQRDGLMLALYTGLRSEDVRTIRFEHVDWDAHTLEVPDPKGGEGAAFTIPLSTVPLQILERRKASNARDLGAKDGGWAFPALDNEGRVGPIGDLRQQIHGEDGHSRFPAEDVHTLRRTWESIAQEEGISELDQHVLSNHSFGARNVNATYIAQHIDHLAACATKIDAGITRRLNEKNAPKGKRGKGRAHLRLVENL